MDKNVMHMNLMTFLPIAMNPTNCLRFSIRSTTTERLQTTAWTAQCDSLDPANSTQLRFQLLAAKYSCLYLACTPLDLSWRRRDSLEDIA